MASYFFNFNPGQTVASKYEVVHQLGTGWEGEVYLLKERSTKIERAGKFFYPQRNPHNRTLKIYAKKLHKLRHCPIVMRYHTQEKIRYQKMDVSILISEYIEGERLDQFLKRQPGKRLSPFMALHLLHALTKGMEQIHQAREYHGDLHTENVIIKRYGLGFDIKLFDLFHWKDTKAENIRQDILDMIRLFYDALGGPKWYAKQPREVKGIIMGLKRTMILKKFRTAGRLRQYLETMEWE